MLNEDRLVQVIMATDAGTVRARQENDFKKLKLLPRDCWTIHLLNIGGCKLPRRAVRNSKRSTKLKTKPFKIIQL